MPFPDILSPLPPTTQPDYSIFPSEFVAGDTLFFSFPDKAPFNSGNGFALSLSIRAVNNGAAVSDSQGTLNAIAPQLPAGSWNFAIPAATTAIWSPQKYQFELYAANGGANPAQRVTLMNGFFAVVVNLATVPPGSDLRSHARRTLDLIEALIEGRAGDDILVADIEKQRFERMSPAELLRFHSYYTAKVRSETAKTNVANGRASGRNIFARFTAPA